MSLPAIFKCDARSSLLAVEQADLKEVLTFLAEVTAGTTTGEHVKALERYASTQKSLAIGRSYLKLSAQMRFTEVSSKPKSISYRFDGTMHITQPDALCEIRFSEINPSRKKENLICPLKRKQMAPVVELRSSGTTKDKAADGNHRPPRARNLAIDLELESHLSWGENHASKIQRVEWFDLKEQPIKEWILPIYSGTP